MTYSKDKNNYLLNKNWRDADEFIYNCYRASWSSWLSCVESNNEIELPRMMMCNDVEWYEPSEVVDAIEAQGFRVKV